MNEIREILTKAVIGKGSKKFEMPVRMPQTSDVPGRVLGAFITAHSVKAEKVQEKIEATGSYDVHVWYTDEQETHTNVVRLNVAYGDTVALSDALRTHFLESDELLAEEVVAPFATDVWIEAGVIVVDVAFELQVEVIGETKMRVAILGPVLEEAPPVLTFGTEEDEAAQEDDLAEIDAALNPHFLDAIIEPFE